MKTRHAHTHTPTDASRALLGGPGAQRLGHGRSWRLAGWSVKSWTVRVTLVVVMLVLMLVMAMVMTFILMLVRLVLSKVY